MILTVCRHMRGHRNSMSPSSIIDSRIKLLTFKSFYRIILNYGKLCIPL